MNKFNYFYCKSWFWSKKRPTEIWSEEQAKQAHDECRTYTVLVNDRERPYAVIDVAGSTRFVGVTFLDDLLRESLSYHFKEVELGKLFLSMATHRYFDGDKDQVKLGNSYIFNEDGKLIIRKQSFNPQSLAEVISSTDVSGNYDKYPNFGEYDYLLKVER
ncbi:hypothetical protein ACA689_000894 [Vibrio vulnificus]|uniref:Lytic transglycosylase n=1 Tax=Vibrio vulnificus TaxID=672 RepID=A0AAW4H9H9_VIBVL|nr:hypothetical protein [Vibrio vulnificus]EHD0090561.1 lytic transglycosylase [Vibrio vulnificus]EHU4917220.1 hypothetical protein [Vibrio vulnificus]EHU5005474.1 hypothetical protein [Vibrio vulnificus]EHZ2743301.1 hypothetical protein [Vibrio vulnificus]EIO3982285.1 hypothetical protein [Vibrio vulnificus]